MPSSQPWQILQSPSQTGFAIPEFPAPTGFRISSFQPKQALESPSPICGSKRFQCPKYPVFPSTAPTSPGTNISLLTPKDPKSPLSPLNFWGAQQELPLHIIPPLPKSTNHSSLFLFIC